MMGGGDASPYDLPEREALDALASLARRVGASVALSGASLQEEENALIYTSRESCL
jgi:hypothetical protein